MFRYVAELGAPFVTDDHDKVLGVKLDMWGREEIN
jgi:hypothetical protein